MEIHQSSSPGYIPPASVDKVPVHTELTAKGWQEMGENLQSMGGTGVWGNTPYLQNIQNPTLAAVLWNLSDQKPGQEFQETALPSNVYYDAFSEKLQQLIDTSPGLTEEQVNNILEHHLYGDPPVKLMAGLEGKYAELSKAGLEALQSQIPDVGTQARHLLANSGSLRQELDKLREHAPAGSQLSNLLGKINSNLNSINENMSQAELSALAEDLAKNLTDLNQELQKNEYVTLSASINTSTLKDVANEIVLSGKIFSGNAEGASSPLKLLNADMMGANYDSNFNAELAKLQNLPEPNKMDAEMAQKLLLIFNGAAKPGDFTPDLTAQFEAVKQAALQASGLPAGYEPHHTVASDRFLGQLANQADQIFEQVLDAQDPPLNDTQKMNLLNIYHGIVTGEVPTEIMEQVSQEIEEQLGLPKGSKLPKSSNREAQINGEFMIAFMSKLNNLSSTQKEAVLAALANPLNPVDAATRKLIKELFDGVDGRGGAAADIREQFGLPDDWKPPVALLREIGTMTPTEHQAVTQVNNLQASVNVFMNLVKGMPDGPEKNSYMNILKIVMEAMADLKAMVALMQTFDFETASKLSSVSTQAALDKIEVARQKKAEIEDKESKMASMPEGVQVFLKVLQYIGEAVASCMGGPIGIALFIAQTVIKETSPDKDKNMIGDAFKAVFEFVSETVFGWLPNPLNEIMGLVGQMALVYASLFSGTFTLGFQLFINGGVIETAIGEVLCPENASPEEKAKYEMAAQITAMAVKLAVDITAMVVMSIVSGGAGGAAMVGKILDTISKITHLSQKVVNIVMRGIPILIQLATTTLAAINVGIQANNRFVQADIIELRGKLDAMTAEMEASIAGIRKLLNKLLDMITGMSAWVAEIDQGQKRFVQGQSETLNAIFQG